MEDCIKTIVPPGVMPQSLSTTRPLSGSSRPLPRAPASAGCGRTALRRVLFLHDRLGGARRLTAMGLARELEVSDRTIKRDIEFMRELGAPIEWEPSTGTYFYSRPCDLLPLLRLEADEALALVLASQTFSAWRGSPLGRALTAALGKIAGVVGGAVSLPVSEVRELVSHPGEEADGAEEHRFFGVLIEAIRRRREVRAAYRKPRPGARAEERVLHPLHLAFLDHRWMLVAHDPQQGGRRNFVLGRFANVEPTGVLFTPPVGFDLSAYLRGSLGRFTGEGEHEVRVALDAIAAPYVRERPWHPSQVATERADGGIEVTLRLNNLIDVERRVLACGAHAEVLAPPELRSAVGEAALATAGRYGPVGK